jgi:hypothetical protein
MSRNGSGTYTLPAGNPVVTGTTISSTWANNTLNDIAATLTDSLAADGQTTATGNLKMGGNRITGMADGLAATDAASVSQVTTAIAGLGTMATQNANAVAVTGGTINGTTIGATTATTGKFTTATVTKIEDAQGGVLAPISSVMRNRIINGAMVIDQRNDGASVTITSGGTLTLDRWKSEVSQASKFSVQQNAGAVTPPVGFTNYLGVTSLSAYSVGASEQFLQRYNIEGFNTADLDWGTANAKTVTLSFWVRSSLTGTFGGSFQNSATDRNYPFSYTISSANTWELKSITVAGDTTGTWLTTNGVGIRVNFSVGSGTTYSGTAGSWGSTYYVSATGATSVVGTNGATFYITGVQLEKGTQATSFEYRQYGTELQLCQRYYQIAPFNGTAVSTIEAGLSGQFKVTMRATPSLSSTIYSGLNYTGTINNLSTVGIGITAIGSVGFGSFNENTIATITGTGFTAGRLYFGSTTASAEL